jgi:phosphate-selective porin OprO/OprP
MKKSVLIGVMIVVEVANMAVSEPALAQDRESNAALVQKIELLESRVRQLEQEQDEGPMMPAITVSGQGPFDDLDRKVGDRERRWELEEDRHDDPTKQPATASAGGDGFSMKSPDGNYQIRFRGLLHADGRFFLDDDNPELVDTFLLRRVRPILGGTIAKYFDFYFMPDFAEGRTVIQDAFINTRFCPEFQVRVGKGKTPFGLERLQSGCDIEFVERSLANNIVPNRDIGVQVLGELWDGVLYYNVGVFNGVPDGGSGDFDTDDDKDFAARIFAHPFRGSDYEWLEGLGLGIAATFGNEQGTSSSPNLPLYRTPGQQTFFSFRNGVGGAIADGDRLRVSPQAYYYCGSFGLLTEYVASEQDIARGGNSASIFNDAWQIAAYYVLTGERASYQGVAPARPFDPHCGQWGALELVARYSALDVDDDAFPVFADPTQSARAARAWSVGLNWYLNKNIKVVFDYEHTSFDGGAAGGRDREDERVFFSRMQIVF